MTTLDYPAWLRIEHSLNVLFITLLICSGIEIGVGAAHHRGDAGDHRPSR